MKEELDKIREVAWKLVQIGDEIPIYDEFRIETCTVIDIQDSKIILEYISLFMHYVYEFHICNGKYNPEIGIYINVADLNMIASSNTARHGIQIYDPSRGFILKDS